MGFVMPGTISVRTVNCEQAACACATDPDQRHGPCIQWSRTVKAHNVNKMLTAEQLETYPPWIDNLRRLRALTNELKTGTPSLHAMHTTEG